MRTKKQHERGYGKGFSLKWGLVAIALTCWVLPILVIMLTVGYYSNSQIRTQIADTVTTGAAAAVKLVESSLLGAMGASRSASYDPAVKNAYAEYIADGDEVALYDAVMTYLSRQYHYNDAFSCTMLYFVNAPDTVYYTNSTANKDGYTSVRRFKENAAAICYKRLETLGTKINFLYTGDRLYMLRNIVDERFTPFAAIVMEIDADVLFSGFKSIVWLEAASVQIGETSIPLVGEPSAPESASQANGVYYAFEESAVALLSRSRLENDVLTCVMRVDSAPLTDRLSVLTNMILPMTLLVIPLLALFIWAFYRYVSRPVNQMVDAAERIEHGERGYQMETMPESREFRYLVRRFNSMSASMKEQFERSYNEQLALQDARMKALQSQINPHFLNNTLEIINWEARMAGNVNVSRMIEALSTMLAAATARGGKSTAHLSEELAFVDAYLYIISVRMGSRLTVKKEIDETLLPLPVPRLIMQPVVENAVEHGIANRPTGMLTLRVYRQDDRLCLEVENDAPLRPEDKESIERLLGWDGSTEDKLKSTQLGIRNVNHRLKLLFSEAAGLTIAQTPGMSTVAKIVLPIDRLV